MNEEEYIEDLDDDEDLDGNMLEMSDKNIHHKPEANWGSVLQFLKDKQREVEIKETEWMIERQQLKQRISILEAQNKAYENSNNDCMRRIKMLELALRQERIRYARAANGLEGKLNILKDNPNTLDEEKLPERPAFQPPKAHQSILLKFLEEIGFEDVFNSSDVGNIKELFSKASANLSQNQELLDTVSKIEDEVRSRVEKEEQKAITVESKLKNLTEKEQLNFLLK